MKDRIKFWLLLIALQLSSLQAEILIENITLIDAKNEIRNAQTVYIENGVIQSIKDSESSDLIGTDSDSKLIDGTGKYLIPGLWDAHVLSLIHI